MTWRQRWQDRWQRTSFQAQWKAIFAFCGAGDKTCGALAALGAMHSALPDWLGATGLTAYSYGLFWIAVSCLPKRWLAQSSFTYVPDFQQQRQEVGLRV